MTKIVAISDVTLGYGSPQILGFVNFLLSQYKDSDAVIIEPDQLRNTNIKFQHERINIIRIPTVANVHTGLGRIEYLRGATNIVKNNTPKILVLFCSFVLPVMLLIKVKPMFVIYYNTEMASYYGKMDDFINENLRDKIDLLIYPEKNRAMLDISKYGDRNIPSVVIYNTSVDDKVFDDACPENRTNKIIYQGTLDSVNTNSEYFLNAILNNYKIDIYGNFSGKDADKLKEKFICLSGNVRYLGYVENTYLSKIRKKYAYGIVMWAPINDNQYYAAPNKFFDFLADGVPPISAPHPQCKYFIKKYNCGILMKDWSIESLLKAIEKAMDLFGTPSYQMMVDGCRKAFELEANWQVQMKKIKPYLKCIGENEHE